MTHLDFTLKIKKIQKLIEKSLQNNLSRSILMTVFNQVMEEEATEYLQANNYESTNDCVRQGNSSYERA